LPVRLWADAARLEEVIRERSVVEAVTHNGFRPPIISVLFVLVLIIALIALHRWATHDEFTARKQPPSRFD